MSDEDQQRPAISFKNLLLVFSVIACGNALGHDTSKPIRFFSYHSDEPGCRANPATDLTLPVGDRWIIIAPRRVVSPEAERKRAGGPLDIEIAEPLQSALRQRLTDSQSLGAIQSGESNITRLKIVSVSHDVVGLGMGKAQAHIRLDFLICINGDVSETSVVKTVTRNGPNMSTLWHQPRGEELQQGFQRAADEAIDSIVDFALHPSTR
jgi:hypothetical protein